MKKKDGMTFASDMGMIVVVRLNYTLHAYIFSISFRQNITQLIVYNARILA